MFNIGKDLGEIKTSVDRNNKKLDKVYLIINDHTKRIERLEQKRSNKLLLFYKKTRQNRENGAEDEIRTRDICLGKATLYH